MTMTTILGAGGAIGNELAKILAARNTPFRLVSRSPKPVAGAELLAADLADREQTVRAVAGSSVVHLLAGLKYELRVWHELWPRVMANAIEACKRAQAKLIFFDNVYMYGKVDGPMTEDTPYAPCSKKGEIRAKIATSLMNEVKAGGLSAMIARSADFYGPDTQNGVPNVLVFEAFAKGSRASWLVNAAVPHSLTFTPDAVHGLTLLAERESGMESGVASANDGPSANRQRFHCNGFKGIRRVPKILGVERADTWLAGWFNPFVREFVRDAVSE